MDLVIPAEYAHLPVSEPLDKCGTIIGLSRTCTQDTILLAVIGCLGEHVRIGQFCAECLVDAEAEGMLCNPCLEKTGINTIHIIKELARL